MQKQCHTQLFIVTSCRFAFLPEDILFDPYTETMSLIQIHETTASNIAFIER
jgi:hypothetical protein